MCIFIYGSVRNVILANQYKGLLLCKKALNMNTTLVILNTVCNHLFHMIAYCITIFYVSEYPNFHISELATVQISLDKCYFTVF